MDEQKKPQIHRPHQGRTKFDPQRVKARPRPLEVIPKGPEALTLIDLFGCLTGGQLARSLYFNQPTRRGDRRSLVAAERAINQMTLRPLKDLGLVAVVQHRREHFDPRKWLSPFVYWELNILTAKGARALNDWFVDRGVSGAVFWHKGLKETVQGYGAHDLEIINAGVTLHAAASLEGYLLNDWLRDRDFRSQAARGAFIPFLEPDAAITLGKDDRLYPFFIEIDRGTTPSVGEQDNAWQTKMRSYARALRDYYRRSPFFDTQIPPRVLTITTNAARLEALRTATRRAEGKDTYLFTLRSSLDPIFIPKRDPAGATLLAENGEALQEKTAPDTLGPIWVTPDDDEPRALRDYLRPRSLTA